MSSGLRRISVLGMILMALKSKTMLAVLWFAFTLTMVAWWWMYSLRQTELKDSAHRMFFWEGSSLIAFVLMGGGTLVLLTYRDERRHDRLRLFFSNFTHDIKTSIARLQLQAEVLKEELEADGNPVLGRLIADVQRLDLQLENSLWFANLDDSALFIEAVSLRQLLENLRSDFADLKIDVEGDSTVFADRRALSSVLRNIMQNSVIHGKAKSCRMRIQVQEPLVKVLIIDDGLGRQPETSARGNGIGLNLSKRLMKKMKGELLLEMPSAEEISGPGFTVQLVLRKALS